MKRITRWGLAAWLLVVLQGEAGVSYTTVTRSEGGGPGGNAADMTSKVSVEGSSARMEVIESRNPMLAAGTYLVTQDAGKLMYLVNPKDKTYATWDMEKLMASAGDMMNAMKGMMDMQIVSPKVETLLDEAGPTLLGLPTRHYKLKTTYTTVMTIMGMKQETKTEIHDEVWATDAFKDAGMAAWKNMQGLKTGNASLDKLMQAQLAQVKGYPVKKVTQNRTTNPNGQANESRMVMELKDVQNVSLAKRLFEVPAGYTETVMAMGPGPDAPGARGKGAQPPGGMPKFPAGFPFSRPPAAR